MVKFLKVLSLFLILATTSIVLLWAQVFYRTPCALPAGNPPIFEVPIGAGALDISRLLETHHITPYGRAFLIGSMVYRKNLAFKPGEYLIKKPLTSWELMHLFASGNIYKRRFTVIPGHTTAQVLRNLEVAGGMVGTITTHPNEGTLLPETYLYVKGQDRQAILNRMTQAMEKTLSELWQNRTPNSPLQNSQEALILASIVEKEAGAKDDPAVVASVFHNRLKQHMRLQSDPTVVYGMTRGEKKLDRRISKEDLATDSPYNTYRRNGLPMGPICNPSKRVIKAVLNPAQTDYLYFVADGKGGHQFSSDLDGHRQNHAEWRRLRTQGNRNAPVDVPELKK